jgi:hypothetical protein
MNLQAAVKGIAPAGGIRPASHITASSVSATKAEPAAHYFGGVPPRSPYGVQGAARCELIPRLHLAAVIEGHAGDILGCSDLSRSSTFPADASACMRNMDLNQQVSPAGRCGNAEDTLSGSVSTRPARPSPSISDVFGGRRDGRCMSVLDSRKPHAEKVSAHRPRQNYRCAPRSVRHHERPLPWKASRLRDPSAGFWQDVPEGHRSGGSEHRQGTLTITGSNVRLGTEMPVALSLFL